MVETTSTNLFEKIVLPHDFTEYTQLGINNNRVTIPTSALKLFNQQVDALIKPELRIASSAITLNMISDKLADLADFSKTSLNIRDLTEDITIPVNSESTNIITLNYDLRSTTDESLRALGIGTATITLNIDTTNTVLDSTTLKIDNSVVTSNSNYDSSTGITSITPVVEAQAPNMGIKQVNINLDLEDTTIKVNSSNLTLLHTVGTTATKGIGFKTVKVDPVLSSIEVQPTAFSSSSQVEIIPTTDAIGFNKITLPIKAVPQNITINSEATNIASTDLTTIKVDSTNTDTTILKATSSIVKTLVTDDTIGPDSVSISIPGNYYYTLSSPNTLLREYNDVGNTKLVIQNNDSNYYLNGIILPKISKTKYTIEASDLADAIKNPSITTLNIKTSEEYDDLVLFDELIINLPKQISATIDDGLFNDIFCLKSTISDVTPSITNTNKLSLNWTTDFINNFAELTDLRSTMTTGESYSYTPDGNASAISSVNNNINSLTQNYFYATNKNNFYKLQLFIDRPEAYTVNVYQAADISRKNNDATTAVTASAIVSENNKLLSFTYNGRSLDNDLNEIAEEKLKITFSPDYAIYSTQDTDENGDPLVDANGDPVIVNKATNISIIQGTDITNESAWEDLLNDITTTTINTFGLRVVDEANLATKYYSTNPVFLAEFVRLNRVDLKYTAQEQVINFESENVTGTISSTTDAESPDTIYQALSTITYNDLTYVLTRSGLSTEITGAYTAVLQNSTSTYVYDFIVTEDTITFYPLTKTN